jgi:hypothetical protein
VVIGPSAADESTTTLAAASDSPGPQAIVDRYPEAMDPAASSVASDPLRARCDAAATTVSATAFPIAAWHAQKVRTVVVLGDAHCASRVAAELSSAPAAFRPRLVAGLSGLEIVYDDLPMARTTIRAGAVPARDDAPASLRELWAAQGPVGWWGALGHDGAALAMAALPADVAVVVDPAGVQARRAAAWDRLLQARVELWSTSATGLAGATTLARTGAPLSVGASTRWRPKWAP